jgi:1-aminocyclopropane-1-carboxylate deaminase/D-cysteine desulfhydrase-like pyridoxal-dependent ACC family enzyme
VGAGASSPLGCLGYAVCAQEIIAQEQAAGLRFSRIVVPNGSSGTHAGLAAGLKAAGEEPSRVQSFTVLAQIREARETTARLAAETLTLLDPASVLLEARSQLQTASLAMAMVCPLMPCSKPCDSSHAQKGCSSTRSVAEKRSQA